MTREINLLTVNQFSEKYPAFPIGGIRYYIFNEENNGLKNTGAIVRLGRKVLINVDEFFEWIESGQLSGKAGVSTR